MPRVLERCLDLVFGKPVKPLRNLGLYRHCVLRRPGYPGMVSFLTAWIPARYGIKGICLKVKFEGFWVDGWEVVAVGEEREHYK
jgi:hypothetical protein